MSIHEDLKAYIDGELEPGRAQEVSAAIQADPKLRDEAEFIRAVGIEIRSMAANPEVAGIERTLQAVRPRASWWRSPGFRLALGLGAPLIAGLALIGVLGKDLLTRSAHEDTSAERSVAFSAPSGRDKAQAPSPGLYEKLDQSENRTGNKAEPKRAAEGAAVNGSVPEVSGDFANEQTIAGTKGSAAAPGPQEAVHPEEQAHLKEGYDLDRHTKISLEVADPNKARAQIAAISERYGGKLEDKVQSTSGEAIIRVPLRHADGLVTALKDFEPGVVFMQPGEVKAKPGSRWRDPGPDAMATIDVTLLRHGAGRLESHRVSNDEAATGTVPPQGIDLTWVAYAAVAFAVFVAGLIIWLRKRG